MTFQDNGNDIPGCVGVALNGAGQALCTTTLTGGPHIFTAHYSGDANFNAATGTRTLSGTKNLFLPHISK